MKKAQIKEVVEWTFCIILAVVLALIVRYFVGTPTVVNQVSMYSTLIPNDRLILNRTSRGKMPNRGEIITFEAPSKTIIFNDHLNQDNPVAIYDDIPSNVVNKFIYYVLEVGKKSYIKRVIGIAGDHIEIKDGVVYLNNQILEEPYLKQETLTEEKKIKDIVVPNGYVFVMGDNRASSTDSREIGCIPVDKIESKAVFRFWPFSRWGQI